MFGMSYDLFWYGDAQIYFTYMRAYQQKQRLQDANNYSMGQYVLLAISQCVSDALSKGHKAIYPKTPFLETQKAKKELSLMDKIYIMFSKK